MPLITDPDSLSQGTLTNVADLAFTASAGNATTLTGATTLPALADDEWFEIRGAAIPGNDGLYRVNDVAPSTSVIDVEKFTGPDPTDDTSESTDILGTTGASTEKSVMFDTAGLKVYLLEQGNLGADGATMLAIHSFMKEEWKATDNFLMSRADFPMVGISFAAGQWQIGTDPSGNFSGWNFADDIVAETQRTRKLIRNAGWDALDSDGNIIEKFFNVTTLPTTGAFEDVLDQAYYWFGTDNTDTGAAVDYEFPGEVNEPVQYFEEVTGPDAVTGFDFTGTNTITRNDGGSWVTDGYQIGAQITIRDAKTGANNGTWGPITAVGGVDGDLVISGTQLTNDTLDTTMVGAVDNSNVFTTALRIRDADPNGKTFGEANLAAGGETEITSKIIKLGLANSADLNITELDVNITNSPYSEVRLRYLTEAYNRGVDSATLRAWGIVVDCGTYSDANGVSNGTTTFTSADFVLGVGEALADYTGGTLTLHDATAPDRATHTIVGTPTAPGGVLTVVLDSALTNSETSLSFTMQRATPLNVGYLDIFEKIQYQLRQASDINENQSIVVVGKTTGRLGVFEGPTLKMGTYSPENPAGGGSGVIIEGFDPNNTNDLEFTDNGGTARTFPFVAAGTLVFNQGLVDDTDGEYWLYFEYTIRTTNSDIDTVAPSGDSYTLTGTLPNLDVNDYILISGFAQPENNGLFIVEAETTPSVEYDVRKVDGTPVGTAETNQTVSIDQDPYPSPDAIIVNDNSSNPIAGDINATTVAFTFDYDNNAQGGRTPPDDAAVVLIAAGLEKGQVAVVGNLTITESTGLTFSLTSPLERNYLNA